MSEELAHAVVVDFPLQGDWWVAVNSPADRIPSNGTDLLGQRYAFDFIRTDPRPRLHYHPASWLRTLIIGVPTSECYAWGRPVRSVFDATIVAAVDGVPERGRVHPVREAILALRNGLTFTPDRLPVCPTLPIRSPARTACPEVTVTGSGASGTPASGLA